MKIAVNGQITDVQGADLGTVLVELGFGGAKIATALNEAFVPSGGRSTTMLHDGDRLEIVAPQQGG
jgi:sulfur carrier protein